MFPDNSDLVTAATLNTPTQGVLDSTTAAFAVVGTFNARMGVGAGRVVCAVKLAGTTITIASAATSALAAAWSSASIVATSLTTALDCSDPIYSAEDSAWLISVQLALEQARDQPQRFGAHVSLSAGTVSVDHFNSIATAEETQRAADIVAFHRHAHVKRVMVALPLRGEISPATRETLTSTCAALRERNIPVGVYTSEGGSIELARAELLSIFVRSDATHLLMVDADMSFAPEVPLAMLAAEVDVAFVAYRRRQAPHDFLVTRLAQVMAFEVHGGQRTLRVFGGGLGLTMVTRTLVETVAAQHPELEYERGGFVHCGLFLPTIQPDESGVRRFFGEDHSFFARVRAAGFSVYALIDALVTHDGHTGRLADELITEETLAHAELLERSVTNELS